MKTLRLNEVGVPTIKRDIAENVERVLARLGIHTNIEVAEIKTRNGEPMIKVESDVFNTTPVIYKEVRVLGAGFIEQDDIEKTIDLTLNLDYHFVYFDGGENGVTIGNARFGFYPENDEHKGCTFFYGLTLK